MFNKIRTIGKIAKTVSSPITHARNIIKSTFSKKTNQSKISPDIKQPRQLKQTMKKMRSEYEKFGFKKAKTAEDRANIVRTKKSIERMNKLEDLKKKRKEGIKASKETKKMIGTGQAEKVGGSVYHRGIPQKKAKGGRIGLKGGKLVGNQSKIDVAAPFGTINKKDFKVLQARNKNKKKVIG